jgi:phage baseplate assembly protein W
MNPAFGTKLYTVLFEQRDENTKEIIKNLITEELTQWVPEVSVLEISVSDVENHENGDNYKMRINLKFKIKSTNKTDNFEFELENVRI